MTPLYGLKVRRERQKIKVARSRRRCAAILDFRTKHLIASLKPSFLPTRCCQQRDNRFINDGYMACSKCDHTRHSGEHVNYSLFFCATMCWHCPKTKGSCSCSIQVPC